MYTAITMIALLVLTLFSTAQAKVLFDAQCPEVKPVENFNLAAFGSGKWIELARYPNDAEQNINCSYNLYTYKGDHVDSKTTVMMNDKEYKVDGSLKLAANAGNIGKLSFILYQGKNLERESYILDTDYENYAIVYYCINNEEKNSRQDLAWVLSRSVNLSPEIKAKIENFMNESKFLQFDKLIWPDTSCGAAQ